LFAVVALQTSAERQAIPRASEIQSGASTTAGLSRTDVDDVMDVDAADVDVEDSERLWRSWRQSSSSNSNLKANGANKNKVFIGLIITDND